VVPDGCLRHGNTTRRIEDEDARLRRVQVSAFGGGGHSLLSNPFVSAWFGHPRSNRTNENENADPVMSEGETNVALMLFFLSNQHDEGPPQVIRA
jgi:hypothetical protein